MDDNAFTNVIVRGTFAAPPHSTVSTRTNARSDRRRARRRIRPPDRRLTEQFAGFHKLEPLAAGCSAPAHRSRPPPRLEANAPHAGAPSRQTRHASSPRPPTPNLEYDQRRTRTEARCRPRSTRRSSHGARRGTRGALARSAHGSRGSHGDHCGRVHCDDGGLGRPSSTASPNCPAKPKTSACQSPPIVARCSPPAVVPVRSSRSIRAAMRRAPRALGRVGAARAKSAAWIAGRERAAVRGARLVVVEVRHRASRARPRRGRGGGASARRPA